MEVHKSCEHTLIKDDSYYYFCRECGSLICDKVMFTYY